MKRLVLAVLLPVSAACAKQPPRLPVPLEIQVMRIPWEDAFPSDVAVDDSGRVWFTDRLTHVIGRYDPVAHAFARYPTPTEKSAPYGVVQTPDGVLWFAESNAGRLGRVSVATGAIEEIVLPDSSGGPHLLAYSGGRIWFTVREARRWGWYDPATGAMASHAFQVRVPNQPVSLRGAKPYSIAPAPGGGVWIGTYDAPYLLRARPGVDTLELHVLARERGPDTVALRLFASLPDSVRRARGAPMPRSDAVGARRSVADGRGGVWLADFTGGRVVHYLAKRDTFVTYASLDRYAGPYGIGVDPWGRIWYDEMHAGNLVVLDPKSGERTLIPVQDRGAAIRHIAFDRERRRVWLPISDAGLLGMVQLR